MDLVLLDLTILVMDGFSTSKRLRNAGHRASLSVVVLTAKELLAEEERVLQEQSAGVIMKEGGVKERLREVLDRYFRPEAVPEES